MRRVEAVISILLGIIAISAGLTWIYGPWGVVGGGIAFVIVPFLFDIKDDREDS